MYPFLQTLQVTPSLYLANIARNRQRQRRQINRQREVCRTELNLKRQKDEQAKELARLQTAYDEAQDLRAKLEDEGKQNEHLRTLIQSMEHIESDIAAKGYPRCSLQFIVVATKDVWKYVIGKRTADILAQEKSELAALQDKLKMHESAVQFMSYIQHIVRTHHCECCDQDVDESVPTL